MCIISWCAGAFAASPRIAYLLPDIGSPGMNTYVEIFGPRQITNNFDFDGLHLNNPGDDFRVICANPGDSAKIIIGPCIVSWDGRLISTQIFVHPNQAPNSADWRLLKQQFRIPILVKIGATVSNADTFYIVQPQPRIKMLLGVLGSGGASGMRSRRGAMIVDELWLYGSGDYTIDTSDCDPGTPGNQGFLPSVIISKGLLLVGPEAVLSVSAPAGGDAGPGGGGGGNGLTCGTKGGSGFTGGGGNGDQQSGCGDRPAGTGTGLRGGSLSNVNPGESSTSNEGGGGGSGHPFGWSSDSVSVNGYGGGANGPQCCQEFDGGGGGGGFAGPGGSGGLVPGPSGSHSSGGNSVGNACLTPIAGGSGGGGGNVNVGFIGAGNGGGGGGALRLAASSIVCSGSLASNGADGIAATTRTGGGGGGSGGAIDIESRSAYSVGGVNVAYGIGGASPSSLPGQRGGNGSPGRLRADGFLSNAIALAPLGGTLFRGPSIDTATIRNRVFTIGGYGNGEPVKVFIKPESGNWQEAGDVSSYLNNRWSIGLTLNAPDSMLFIAAAESISNPKAGQYDAEPDYVFSQVAASIVIVKDVFVPTPAIATITSVALSSSECDADKDFTFMVHDTGSAQLLLNAPSIVGANGGEFTITEPATFPVTVLPNDSVHFTVHWHSTVFGQKSADILLSTNDPRPNHDPWVISITAYHHGADIALPMTVWNLGEFCMGQDTCIDLPIRVVGTQGDTISRISGSWSSKVFSFVALDSALVLTSGQSAHYRICFAPPDTGTFAAYLTVTALPCNRKYMVYAKAHAVRSSFTTATPQVNFIGSKPGQRRDSTVTFGVSGNGPVEIDGLSLLPPGAFTLDAVTPALPVTLPDRDGDSLRVFFHYIPSGSGNDAAKIRLAVKSACPMSPVVDLNGACVAQASMQMPSVTANVGDTVNIPIVLQRSASFSACGTSTFGFGLKYRRGLLVPQFSPSSATDSAEFHLITLDSVSTAGSDTVLTLPFFATLGDTDRTPLHIESIDWYGSAIQASASDGEFVLSNICRQGGSRFVIIGGPVSLSQNTPNPFSDETIVSFDVNEPSRVRITVTDVLGRRAAVLCDQDLPAGHFVRAFDARPLAPGMYVCAMETPAIALRRIMILQR